MKDFDDILGSFDEVTQKRFEELLKLVKEASSDNGITKLWAKLPSYYVGEKFVRIIPFKDHINIEATAIVSHKNELAGYKITPKGMLQIYNNQEVPVEVLKNIVLESLLI